MCRSVQRPAFPGALPRRRGQSWCQEGRAGDTTVGVHLSRRHYADGASQIGCGSAVSGSRGSLCQWRPARGAVGNRVGAAWPHVLQYVDACRTSPERGVGRPFSAGTAWAAQARCHASWRCRLVNPPFRFPVKLPAGSAVGVRQAVCRVKAVSRLLQRRTALPRGAPGLSPSLTRHTQSVAPSARPVQDPQPTCT
jgi:hypothetical protein